MYAIKANDLASNPNKVAFILKSIYIESLPQN